MYTSYLPTELSQAWSTYTTSSSSDFSYQQFKMSETLGRAGGALWQLEFTLASVKDHFDGTDAVPGAGMRAALGDLSPLMTCGQNSLAYELRKAWAAHLKTGQSLEELATLVSQAIKVLSLSDYFLDETDGYFSFDYSQASYLGQTVEELRSLLSPPSISPDLL